MNNYWMLFAALLAVVLSGSVTIAYVRHKFRIAWRYIESQQHQLSATNDQIIALKKQQILAALVDLRLPAKMPSQHGEDVVLAQYFAFKREGTFVEVGGYDGVDLSNSYFFEALGWNGVLVEPNPALFSEYALKRPYSTHYNCAALAGPERSIELSIVEGQDALSFSVESEAHGRRLDKLQASITKVTVDCRPLSELLDPLEGSIDFISIDVEGAEFAVLQSLDFARHAPEIFLIEDNSNGTDASIESFLSEKGYQKRYRLGCNDFYMKANNERPLGLEF